MKSSKLLLITAFVMIASSQAIAAPNFMLNSTVKHALPVTKSRMAMQKTENFSDVAGQAKKELIHKPFFQDLKLFKSREVELNAQAYENYLQRVQGVNRIQHSRASMLLRQLSVSQSQMVNAIQRSIGFATINQSAKQSCVDEHAGCTEKHGRFHGCGLQFLACLVAKIRGKASHMPGATAFRK